jgi:hypothetical protein
MRFGVMLYVEKGQGNIQKAKKFLVNDLGLVPSDDGILIFSFGKMIWG